MQKQSTPCKQAVFTLLLLFGFSSLLSANERIHSSPEKSQLSGAGVGAGLAALALGPVGIIPGVPGTSSEAAGADGAGSTMRLPLPFPLPHGLLNLSSILEVFEDPTISEQ